MKLDDEVVELKKWDAVRVPPGTWRGYEAGPEGLEIIVIGATIARQLATLVTGPAPTDPFPHLTTRERDVLDALTAGASTTQIAGRLSLTDETVRNHISNILTKLEVVDRTQAVLKAREAGLGR